ncbi:NAD(P)-binding domain-containing protein [Dactylosporangium sp. CA-233914]|uniref:NAD(P)-binding domain-containing protein n=1 Tax=Dactylosporangium sp. CA-233914 TaxID=3239934 RepID=UPI003D8ED993
MVMLPDVATVELAVLGPEGVLAGGPAIVADMSTTAPELSERIAARAAAAGLSALDARGWARRACGWA